MYQETKHILTKTFEQECSIRVYIYLLAWLLLFSDRWTRPSRQSNITFLSFSLDNIPPFVENDHVYLAVMLIYRRITWLIWIIVQLFLKNILEYLLDKTEVKHIDDTLEKSWYHEEGKISFHDFYFFPKKAIKGRTIPSVSTLNLSLLIKLYAWITTRHAQRSKMNHLAP